MIIDLFYSNYKFQYKQLEYILYILYNTEFSVLLHL